MGHSGFTMSGSLKTLLLFDAETRHYRQPVYTYFQREFKKHGYDLKVVYDKNLDDIQDGLFTGIDYTWANFNRIIKDNNCRLIILFVWLRYTFLLPFMLYNRLRGIKTITWSHGINLQDRHNTLKNQFYYLRQRLAHALIIFSRNETQYIKASHKKLFAANNTLNFHDFPQIGASKNQLKERYGFAGKQVVLCVGRLNTNNRKLSYLLQGFAACSPTGFVLVIVGPGVSPDQEIRIKGMENVHYLGTVYDPVKINEVYKMADIFCMPGAIGLAINQAFYHGLPVVMEDVPHGPEGIYLKEGQNGFLFKKGDIEDMMKKIQALCRDKNLYDQFSNHARKTIQQGASVENMFNGFLEAVRYVER
jgi:glycosyltransferase involved in cell wall biosynthesis